MATTGTEQQEECIELKNIKYKTMLLSGNVIKETKSSSDLNNLEKFLQDNKNNNQNEPWSKLDKTIKTKKILTYAEEYSKKNNLTEQGNAELKIFLRDCLDRKKLQRVKDVEYDKTTGEIKDIPALIFNKTTNHFTLKNIDKQRVSTLKSLPPKKTAKSTIKNTKPIDDSDDESQSL
jgi:hypothetical protein